ncbi:helix-turn-helix transcriptional regulator [Fulvivirgaceae bacterium PWU4]|uniref:Helix-turn-helix transcriptional regulator n=1 Tax=Chryseosolibacter histidini TaxID=2782349 RepID=A0AAP2GMZ7_9BACT|nr:helix-turn-helix domain-containing protein [Chryseosolibacter histidini]MBT1696355.1 helix-turn-helix transcriptional regulator [Chryseosolibacter histidini]
MSKQRSDCPISCTLDVIGDKWSLLIIRDVMLRGKMSYSEFLNSEEKIATNILVSRLTVLEEEKILVKNVSPENKSKYIYSLTQKGADLLPIIIELMDWGAKYNKNCPRKELGQKIKKDKSAVVRELSEALKQKVK